jgi:response regulator RpfG family c-di-GMP phosphodiesterase
MGAMNGVEAATQITAMLPQCGVLFLSGHASMADILHTAPKRLVYSFMSKPMHPLDLLNAIAYILPALSPVDEQALVVMQQEIIERYTNKWMLARNRFPLGATQAGTEIWASVPEHFDAVLRDRIPPGSDYPRVQLQ